MRYERTQAEDVGPHNGMKEGVVVGSTEVDGIAGILWDVAGTQPVAPRDSDVIYRLYRQEGASPADDESRPMRGRCFISEPSRPYASGDEVMLETRDGQRIFGTVHQIREMRTGSVSLILDVQHE
jgi:hypothetical protein